MKKQTIFLVMTIVFALLLCGAVSAEEIKGNVDTNPLNSTDNQSVAINNLECDQDPRIYGIVKEIYNESSGTYTKLVDAIPVKGAAVTIKNPADNSIIATGTTNQNGEYDIYFLSTLTEFKVEIAYSTYKTYFKNVIPTGTPIPETQLNHTFMPDIAMIFSHPE